MVTTFDKLRVYSIRLSEKCLSFTDMSFTTMHLYINMKPEEYSGCSALNNTSVFKSTIHLLTSVFF